MEGHTDGCRLNDGLLTVDVISAFSAVVFSERLIESRYLSCHVTTVVVWVSQDISITCRGVIHPVKIINKTF